MDFLFAQVFEMLPVKVVNLLLHIATISVLLYVIRPWLKRLTVQVQKTNGTVTRLQEWKENHEASHHTMHRQNFEILREIRQDVRDINNQRKGKP